MASESIPRPQSRSWPFFLTILALIPEFVHAAVPNVDFARMGTVAVAGSFAGLDIFDSSRNITFNPATSTFLARNSDSSLDLLGETSSGGTISATCTLNGKVYLAGLFSSVGAVSAQNIASYDPGAGTFSPLGGQNGGVNGQVAALYCDPTDSTLWVGGQFKSPTTATGMANFGGAVALYHPSNDSWTPPPFEGLTGASATVLSITPGTSGTSSLLFSGSFLTQFGTNITVAQNISNPAVPSSPGATAFTSSLVPVSLANAAQIEGDPSTTTAGYTDLTNILCPAGADGPGNSWRAQDGSEAKIVIRPNRYITASGIRLGNTFIDGRGAKTFYFTAIPSNEVIPLTFADPVTKQNNTCTDNCPLSNDSTILYQDFLFPSDLMLTGFQVVINAWYGASAGLHILQLLSNGAYASAVSIDNMPSCYAPAASQVGVTGKWTSLNVVTSIAATTQDVLIATVPVGTSSSAAPSLTWYPYVSAAGIYNVYLMVPGCVEVQDCGKRTTVKTTLNPGGGLPLSTATVSEQVDEDTSQLIYSGPITPSQPNYNSTVVLTLADQPQGSGVGGNYDIIADRVVFQLISVGGLNSTSSNGTGILTGTGTPGFGFLEWPSAATASNATGVLRNTTETSLDGLATALATNIGTGVATTAYTVNAVVPYAANSVIFAGAFNLASVGAANVAAYSSGSIIKVGGSGLNGGVSSMAASSDAQTIYMGGAFTDTADSTSGTRYRGVVEYSVSSSTWTALGGGVNGAVRSVSLSSTGNSNQVIVAGNFTRTFSSPSDATGTIAEGFAVYDLGSGAWTSSGGFVVGKLTLAVAGNGNTTTQYLAGGISACVSYGADGWAIVGSGTNGAPEVQQVVGAVLGNTATSASTPASRRMKRRSSSSSWGAPSPKHMMAITKRQTTTAASSPGLPVTPAAPAPAVLSVAYWTNSSNHNHEVVILAGNFSVPNSQGTGLALYDTTSETLSPLNGNQVNGVVRQVLVSGNILYVGGDFAISGLDGRGWAMYDLQAGQWIPDSGLGLSSTSGGNPVVRSITTTSGVSNTILVAGTFTTSGTTPCEAVCAWSIDSKSWSALGSGVHGQAASVDFAGSSDNVMVVGGALTLADGTPANVAAFSFATFTWEGLGSPPGPVTAVAVNNNNQSSVYAAGSSSDGTSPFLAYWNGQAWTTQASSWEPSTSISQMKFVPLLEPQTGTGAIAGDRMLFIAGAIDSSTQGAMSSALYDGNMFVPFLVSSNSDGSNGFMSGLFNSYGSSFSFSQHKFLATGIVILISIAIATGIVFLLLLLGILWALCSRRDAGLANPNPEDDDEDTSSFRHGPSALLAHINAATRTTILGSAALGGAAAMAAHQQHHKDDSYAQDHDAWVRAETPSDAMAGGVGVGVAYAGDEEDVNRPTHARYSFAGGAEGELPVAAGQEVIVLDDRDQAWWYVRDPATGREGVVPASYLY
ncbi:hypothetical protein FRB94_005851 [Tulasnella sp. JGI-2019a]|nr:hypothetical protein FRB94_005851 [Tulasnella sp. JGI-2019a]